MSNNGWIGVDLDGTLAEYSGWQSATHIGKAIEPMIKRVKNWLLEGKVVRIFTARVYRDGTKERDEEVEVVKHAIRIWCVANLGKELEITNIKDFQMIELWDDRVVQVIPNTGIALQDLMRDR
jgi:hypothetical protein